MRPLNPHRVLALLVCLASAAAPAAAQEAKPAEKVDHGTPKPVAVAFAKAMTAADVKALRELSTGTEDQFKSIEAFSTMLASLKRFKLACDAKFGAENALSKGVGRADDLPAQVERSEFKIDGDTATFVNKDAPGKKDAMRLKRADGKWKVDLASMGADAVATARKAPALAKVFNEAAADIEAGKYQNVQDAMLALEARMRTSGAAN